MEYLHSKLQGLKKIPDFNYHAKCQKLQIIDSSFVVDLLFFTRGDIRPVHLVVEMFNAFSNSTGLYVNPSKCKIYYGGMEDIVNQRITELTMFATSPLPLRYLGIPVAVNS